MQIVTKQTLRIYWEHSVRYKGTVVILLLTTLLASAGGVTAPMFTRQLFKSMAQDGPAGADIQVAWIWHIATLAVLMQINYRFRHFKVNFHQPRVVSDLMCTCYRHLLYHSQGFFTNNFVGSLVTKVRRYSHSYGRISDTLLYQLMPTAYRVAFTLVILTYVRWQIGMMTLAWSVLYTTCVFAFARYKLQFDIRLSRQDTKTTAQLADTLTNNSNITSFAGEKREIERFEEITEELYRRRRFSWNLMFFAEIVQGLAMVTLEIAVLYASWRYWQAGQLSLVDLMMFQVYLGIIFERLWDFNSHLKNVYEGLADANEMTEILMLPHEVVDAPNASALVVSGGGITFENVEFRYHPEAPPILSGLNLFIRPGAKVGLVGPSGAGKSTVTKLVLRFKDIQSGRISIDGQDISQVTQESLRRSISLVPQDPTLFHRSIRENIGYGKPDATDEEIIAAAKAAHAHEFISAFPDKYGTFVGERGVKLSGGERQRVAIARAILENAPILLMDEATSSLDSESEKLVQDALSTLMEGRTTIIIAHRLQTIRKMDRIIVIEKGKVVEDGPHSSLLEDPNSIYFKLWNIQNDDVVTSSVAPEAVTV